VAGQHASFPSHLLHKIKSFAEVTRKSNAIFYCAIEKVIIEFKHGSGFKVIGDGNAARLRRIG